LDTGWKALDEQNPTTSNELETSATDIPPSAEIEDEEQVSEEPIEYAPPPPRRSRQIERPSSKRLALYADIRRIQYETLNQLLETITRVDELNPEYIEQLRDAIFHTDHPFLVTFVGPFSSGKSSVINALLGAKVMDVGPIPTTDHIAILRHGEALQKNRAGNITTIFYPSELLERVSLVDTPGLESVFSKHDELTRKFLHRADIVFLVMLATQVLTASNLAFMESLKVYGKRMVIVVNQIDLLEEADRQTVKEFVQEQSRIHLGIEPQIWLVSAKQALQAYEGSIRDEILWDESGFADLEEYLFDTLSDEQRVLQKLDTPLQVARNIIASALEQVQTAQRTLIEHRKTVENIQTQIAASEKDRRKRLEKIETEIEQEWNTAIDKGSAAIEELFQIQRALGQSLAGILEIVGIGVLARRFRKRTQAEEAFLKYEVRDTLQRIPELAEKIGPTLEGRDQEEIDQLVDYTRQQITLLPDTLKNKLIGKVQTPMSYDRKALRNIRDELDNLIDKASNFETARIDRALRSTMILMAVWMFITILFAILIATGSLLVGSSSGFNVILVLVLFILGMALLPLRGSLLQYQYRRQMQTLQRQYMNTLHRAAEKQITYGTQLRQDVVEPFTRLITTQSEQLDELKLKLETHQQQIIGIQHKLSSLMKD